MNPDKLMRRLIVPPGRKISLKKDFDPALKGVELGKKQAEELLAKGVRLMAEHQDKLYADDRYGLLIVLQAMDAAGKDGTIKHVMSGLNPQGVQVYSFKAPSSEELDHDYLWRCSKAVPERGRIGIFNRSYYEEVLVARVHPEILDRQKLPPDAKGKGIWKRRFEEINNFEKYLVNNGFPVLKFFLNVSRDEQKRRFLERIERPEKNWKFSPSDAKERGFWDDYQRAYEDCFNHTSTKWAPWHVIPADNKPLARLAVSMVIYTKLQELHLRYPKVSKEQQDGLAQTKEILEKEK
jgi:PPK2 family polyphosphate:nucleotide phosphotransferase